MHVFVCNNIQEGVMPGWWVSVADPVPGQTWTSVCESIYKKLTDLYFISRHDAVRFESVVACLERDLVRSMRTPDRHRVFSTDQVVPDDFVEDALIVLHPLVTNMNTRNVFVEGPELAAEGLRLRSPIHLKSAACFYKALAKRMKHINAVEKSKKRIKVK